MIKGTPSGRASRDGLGRAPGAGCGHLARRIGAGVLAVTRPGPLA